MVSLIMGLLALVCNIVAFLPITNIGGYLAVIGFVLAIVAVATGSKVLKVDKMDKNARAGKAIGVVCIVVAIIAIIINLILLPFGIIAAIL